METIGKSLLHSFLLSPADIAWPQVAVVVNLTWVVQWLWLALSKGPNKDPVSEALCALVSRIPDDERSPKTQQYWVVSVYYTPSSLQCLIIQECSRKHPGAHVLLEREHKVKNLRLSYSLFCIMTLLLIVSSFYVQFCLFYIPLFINF
jgi:hypothetical protein